MCPSLIQEMARQHRESLQREVAREVPFASEIEPGHWKNFWILQKKSAAFGRRLILALGLLSLLMPLLGMAIGISLPVLIAGSLFCLLVIFLSVVSGRI
jgi:hypothetical protein